MGTKTEHWCDLCKTPMEHKLTLKLILKSFAHREILSMDACEECTEEVAKAVNRQAREIANPHEWTAAMMDPTQKCIRCGKPKWVDQHPDDPVSMTVVNESPCEPEKKK